MRAQQSPYEVAGPRVCTPRLDLAVCKDKRRQVAAPRICLLLRQPCSFLARPCVDQDSYPIGTGITVCLGASVDLEQQRGSITLAACEELIGPGNAREKR